MDQDPKSILQEYYGITAESCGLESDTGFFNGMAVPRDELYAAYDAGSVTYKTFLDEWHRNNTILVTTDVYRTEHDQYYRILLCKQPFPGKEDEILSRVESYDSQYIQAGGYVRVKPHRPIDRFLVYKIEPLVVNQHTQSIL